MRTRVLAAVLGAAAVGMSVAGVTSYLVQRERVDARIDDHIAQEVEELRSFAASGLDPDTGEQFATVRRFFEIALRRNVPDRSEGLLTLVDGDPAWVPAAEVDLRLQDDPEFVRTAAAFHADTRVRPRTAETTLGTLRYVVVPVSVPGDSAQGLYVIAYSRDMEQAEVVDAYRTYAVVAAGALAVIGAVGWAVAGRLLRPIRLLRETAQRISDTDLSGRIPVTGSGDDISELARTVNAMLDRLEAAFGAQRDALDDAGHELRTPITVIRGHLELMDTADPADVVETRDIALDELDRMHRMVDDLVVLAKAKRPDFVKPRPVRLDKLVDDVLDKARPLADRQWQVDHRAEATAMLDEQRVTQALLQLVSNAVKFTEPDDVIAIGCEVAGAGTDGREARLWVRDTGPGVGADEAERIFDRFARGDLAHGVDGSGLGLAIVRAIAEAHRGSVSLSSQPGAGATFVISLPLVPSPSPELVEEA